MKKATFLIIFLCCIYSYGQDIEDIKKLDTIYVKFKKSVYQTTQVAEDYRFYTINLKQISDRLFLSFTKPDFKDYSRKENKGFLPRIENKSFLKKHKKEIIGINFFKKYGIVRSTYEAFEKCNVIYIIDCDEQKNGKITLYQVLKSSSYRMSE